MANVAFEWVVPESRLDECVTAIEVEGGTVEDSSGRFRPRPAEAAEYPPGFEPFMVVVAVASVAFLGQAVHRMIRDDKVRGGTVVDVRGGKLRIRPVPNMPTGRLLIVQDSGTQTFDREEANAGAKLLSEILGKLGKTAP